MANLKERNIALVSKDSEGVTTIDYPLTSTEMVEGLEEFVKKFAQLGTTLAAYGITDAKIENGIITLGDNTITPITNLDNVAKTNTANTWTAPQEFQQVKVVYENYFSVLVSGTSHTPKSSVMYYNAIGAFTLDLSVVVSNLSPDASTVFTAFFKSTGDYTLTIKGAGAIKYTGSASDVALAKAGLLLNILIVKDASGTVTSIVQASKLS